MNATVSGAELIKQNPTLAASVFKRHKVSEDQARSLHFLFVQNYVADEDETTREARIATTAVVFNKPVAASVVSSGTALKSPEDTFHSEVGKNIAAARAVRRLQHPQ